MRLDRIASRTADTNLSRRNFLAASAAVGGGLMLSLSLPFGRSEAAPRDALLPAGSKGYRRLAEVPPSGTSAERHCIGSASTR